MMSKDPVQTIEVRNKAAQYVVRGNHAFAPKSVRTVTVTPVQYK
jgi:hypothetical protein